MGTFLEFRASKKSEEKDYQHWLIFNMLRFWRDVAYIFNLYQFAVDDLDLLVIFFYLLIHLEPSVRSPVFAVSYRL